MTNRRSIALLGLLIAGFAIAVIAAFGNGDANAGAEARAKGFSPVSVRAMDAVSLEELARAPMGVFVARRAVVWRAGAAGVFVLVVG
jgi:hypothetical protein